MMHSWQFKVIILAVCVSVRAVCVSVSSDLLTASGLIAAFMLSCGVSLEIANGDYQRDAWERDFSI